jgi:putative hydrolase of the HAD superfamily
MSQLPTLSPSTHAHPRSGLDKSISPVITRGATAPLFRSMHSTYPDLLAIPSPTIPPQVIFLDAVGTIFGVRGSVGQVYTTFAQKYGADCDPTQVNRAFYQHFKAAAPGQFAGLTGSELATQEYAWWRKINHQTFTALGKIADFTDFDAFFDELYHYFATAAAWEIYPDALPALQQWRSQGIPLELLSNFDTRLYAVLAALNLKEYFSRITISTVVGVAKPEPAIFQVALAGRAADQVWHIGDSELEDYQGATAAGLQAFLLIRS